MRQSSKVALGGVLSSVAFVIMLFSFVDFGGYIFPAVSGIIISILLIEIDGKTSFISYISVSILSLILISNVEAKLMFIMFFGYFPSLKIFIDKKIANKKTAFAVKLLIFNVMVVSCQMLLFYVFAIDPEMFEIFGVNLPILFWVFGNVTFLLYERVLNNFNSIYERVLREKINKLFKR